MGKENRTERAPRKKLNALVTQNSKRKQLKPITEKIRRERINNSLHELKVLVLGAMNKDILQYTKMEKADILDMAVKYIKCIQTSKQESEDGCLGPTQGNHQESLVTSPDKTLINTNHTSRRQSNASDIVSETSWSGMISLVQPEVPMPQQACATIATQKNDASSSVLADYALIPSSGNSSELHRPKANTRGSNSPSSEKISFPRFYSPSREICYETFKMRSPLAEKKHNSFSTPATVSKKLLIPTNFEKKENASPLNSEQQSQNHVRLPGMECFVKDTYMAEDLKENQIYSNCVFMNQRRESEIDQFDSAHYSFPLWRPW